MASPLPCEVIYLLLYSAKQPVCFNFSYLRSLHPVIRGNIFLPSKIRDDEQNDRSVAYIFRSEEYTQPSQPTLDLYFPVHLKECHFSLSF